MSQLTFYNAFLFFLICTRCCLFGYVVKKLFYSGLLTLSKEVLGLFLLLALIEAKFVLASIRFFKIYSLL